ncbi:MAG: hypothetical protein WAV25_01945 [Minisyncoccia bacterium]
MNLKSLKKLKSPKQIQDFLNSLPFNFEKRGETYRGVARTLESKEAHCFEGALVAAYVLKQMGHKPLILDLRATDKDSDHVVAIYKKDGCWGAISKTNHAVLRYREPIYKSVRELAMSYFHEYFLNNGQKTMRSFSRPYDLDKSKIDWVNSNEQLFELMERLDNSPHTDILSKKQIKNLRKADKIEIKTGEIVEYKK